MVTSLRWCADIGMFAYDRSIPKSCVHATPFCKVHCFNDKLYKYYPGMHGKDILNESYWRDISGARVRTDLAGKRTRQTKRVRLMTRGEGISTHGDINRVRRIAEGNPDTIFWLPSRAWRDDTLCARIVAELFPVPNLRVLASLDPSNSAEEIESLARDGFSTMFFGDDSELATAGRFKCPKTHSHAKGHCAVCSTRKGCFSRAPVHVHLKEH